MERNVAPSLEENAYNCPHCRAFAVQQRVNTTQMKGDETRVTVTRCQRCEKLSVWVDSSLVYPAESVAPLPIESMPEDVKQDFLEAGSIVNASPRAAVALLRLALQKLTIELGQRGRNLNDDIGALVAEGLPVRTQRALDAVRVIGNNAVHPGQIDLRDDMETAIALFRLLNMIVDVMIVQPAEIEEIYNMIPEGARQAIEQRDQG